MTTEIERWDRLFRAVLLADQVFRQDRGYETLDGLELAEAMDAFLHGESCERMIDEIKSNLAINEPEAPRLFPKMDKATSREHSLAMIEDVFATLQRGYSDGGR